MLSSILVFLLISPALIQGYEHSSEEKIRITRGVVGVSDKKTQDKVGKTLPSFLSSETFDAYIRRVFTSKDESADKYFARVFMQYEDESNKNYIKRIDTILSQFPSLACKHNPKYWSVIQKYYKLKYGSIQNIHPRQHEHEEEYFSRILKRDEHEDFKSYIKKMDCVYHAYPKLNIWRRIKFCEDYKNWYVYREVDYCSSIRPSLNICESLMKKYARRDSEEGDDFTYFQRICERRTGECDLHYVERMTNIKRKYGDLALWYSLEYADLIKDYYGLLFKKRDNEDLKSYYRRITYKSSSEDSEIYIKRMTILKNLFNNLPLWNNKEYLEFTGVYYKAIYGKESNEDVDTYLKRVTDKCSCEDVDTYEKRMNIVQWVCRNSDFFYNSKYLTYTKSYFDSFSKKSFETDEVWLSRILKRNYNENDDEYVKRLNTITSIHKKSLRSIKKKSLIYASDYYKLLHKKRKSVTVKA